MTEWRDVKGFIGYQVSDSGLVRSRRKALAAHRSAVLEHHGEFAPCE